MYISNKIRTDGFGAQYQTIIFTILYAELKNLEFVYTPFTSMEHNYDDDFDFLNKKENLIKIKNNFKLNSDVDSNKIISVDLNTIYQTVESNLDLCINSNSFHKIKKLFYENYTIPEEDTISVHIRRPNIFDIGDYGYVKDEYYLNVVSKIIEKNKKIKKIKIYSQGKEEDFNNFKNLNIELHLNESIEETFKNLVFSKILVMSKGSFSYCAGLLSDGDVYYVPFWHRPKSSWIIL